MSKFEPVTGASTARVWSGLGHWNLYFILKLALQWGGYLNIQVLPNLLFVAFLLIPLRKHSTAVIRRLLAVPVAMALFYRDTWLPPLDEWVKLSSVMNLSSGHLLTLAGSLVDWSLCGWLLVLVMAYQFVQPWLRMTTLSLAGLAWLSVTHPSVLPLTHGASLTRALAPADKAAPSSEAIDVYLKQFYDSEADRRVSFLPATAAAQPFDLLLINIDSMSWDDLDAVGLRDHPLLRQMDVLFDHFNSAASEQVPAALRLLRAGCGQPPRRDLFVPAPESCLLFDALGKQGFVGQTLLNHTGRFAGFLNAVQTLGSLPEPEVDAGHWQSMLSGPDGSPVWRDREVLGDWWKQRQAQPEARVALFYNTQTLHEGNHVVAADGNIRRADYKARAQALLDDLSGFIEQLEHSGRRVVVVMVPGHGAALRGDRMQLPGMYKIPSPSITQVPVGIKLIGMGRNPRSMPLHVSEPSSYLAVAQLTNRLYGTPSPAGGEQPDWQPLLTGLAQVRLVSESEGSIVLDYAATPYVRITENDPWLPYRPVSQ
ncbi:cellulose synthase operon protein YhjU [Pseudomonas sp. JAI115]|uniref:cellulose biosynthesis protein BcsG n=1 Tax=Pseudomonas sp. JAI115 TaxID=2723061 RepID=UPI001619B1FD|nr:cellulose biosynthesis protein BcsG [Pseudomonas sp. JAI115]MBB6155484.1 cellulose synthase operon protein YhjU [Pseudomonas sp. JAI115]